MNFLNFKGKKVLITGHTGFKGAWLSIWLEHMGANVVGIGLDPLYDDGVFTRSGIGERMIDRRQDIRNYEAIRRIFTEEQPEIVFHLAAQALVRESYAEPMETFATNTMGTVNVLEAIRQTDSVKAAVMVTTDKCYENREWPYGYRESDAMGGHDPYSASKGAAEIVIASYRRSFFSSPEKAGIASARAGNVIGGGDWSTNRIVPDIIKAIERGEPVKVRNVTAVRPWQHVLEPLGGYLLLAMRLLEDRERYAGAWNFGPLPNELHSVRDIVAAFIEYLGKGSWTTDEPASRLHEAHLLTLDINKAIQQLDWRPILDFKKTISLTGDWYTHFRERPVLELCHSQIQEYMHLLSTNRKDRQTSEDLTLRAV